MFELESKKYNIFISHTGRKEEEYSRFEEKLISAHDFEFDNYSTPEEDKTTDESLEKQINPVGVVIILSGLYNKYKNIIQRQIDIAVKTNKPIILIRPFGMENVPSELEEIAEDVVGWNAPCIVDAIEENYQE
ncbi:MAG: TIR domain-containing protein [Methanobacterium sp.]|nr:TIR domain-containing protein [Methanobacterium sp.]